MNYLENTVDPNFPGRKLIANTVVIFYSDNGGLGGYERSGIRAHEITDQYPLRDGKGSLKEGGIRVPLIVRWDGFVKKGSINHSPVITVDFYPTLLELAGTTKVPDVTLDGISLYPAFRGENLNERALFWHFPAYLQGDIGTDGQLDFRTTPASVIRQQDWKLMFYYETRHWELYNLAEDIGENKNIVASYPGIVKELGQSLNNWLRNTGADLPREKDSGRTVDLPDLPPVN